MNERINDEEMDMRIEYCPTDQQKGDLFTKALVPAAFESAKCSIGIRPTVVDEVGHTSTVWDGASSELPAAADGPSSHTANKPSSHTADKPSGEAASHHPRRRGKKKKKKNKRNVQP